MSKEEERLLALHLLKFSEVLDLALMDLMPSRICDYLFTLSTLFNDFYGSCRIIGNEYEGSRVLLCYASATVMRRCFFILGIEPIYKLWQILNYLKLYARIFFFPNSWFFKHISYFNLMHIPTPSFSKFEGCQVLEENI